MTSALIAARKNPDTLLIGRTNAPRLLAIEGKTSGA